MRRRFVSTTGFALALAALGRASLARAGGATPPVVEAATRGDLPALERVLASGADPNAARDADGRTALMEAARLGRYDIARSLLVHGAARDQQDRAGRNAFYFAVDRQHSDLIALLRDAS